MAPQEQRNTSAVRTATTPFSIAPSLLDQGFRRLAQSEMGWRSQSYPDRRGLALPCGDHRPYSRRVIGWALSDRINAIWQSGAADGHQPAPAATRLHPPNGSRLAILQPRLPEAPARASLRGLDERQGGIAMTTQRWRPSSRPSRPSCSGAEPGKPGDRPNWPCLNTSTASTIHGGGIQPLPGRAPWPSRKGPHERARNPAFFQDKSSQRWGS